MNNIIAFIFARGGSKGILKKNIINFNGVPLIAKAIKTALESKYIKEVFISTDSIEIAEIAKKYGAKVPFLRPSELASDSSSELDSWKHALIEIKKIKKCDIFVSIPTTSPLRKYTDIDNCIEMYLKNSDKIDGVVSICEPHRNPDFNIMRKTDSGYVELYTGLPNISSRQEATKIMDLCTVAYVYNSEFILNAEHILKAKLMGCQIPKERAIDIDDHFDLKVARFLDQN